MFSEEKMKISGSFSREDAPIGVTRRFRLPVLFGLPRESKKAPYQVFVLGFQLAVRQPIRDLAKRRGQLSALCARVHGLRLTKEPPKPLPPLGRVSRKFNLERIAQSAMAPALPDCT